MNMLDIKLIRQNPEIVRDALARRGEDDAVLDEVLAVDEERRKLIYEVEQLKKRRNEVSDEIARVKKSGGDATDAILEMRDVSAKIKEMDDSVRALDEKLTSLLLAIPNIPHSSVPTGKD